ncbi:hypothetical protein GPECTOR_10g1092 [Gonium pectorale]|uniref:Tr-type G domain-containing protein n=1 Tax=Gonium pectorale TaxID=33097 RepID=A0A150GQF6_GONPE|nr:hypothetical protein GPECTOR_10g1092 [Gonium pectorale]|eukprot:KXZ52069.1 hypothetical protein GPECTOR_10g1092 [Gonium pectorale]
MHLELLGSSLGNRTEPTTFVAFESNTQPQKLKPKRRKGARGRATAEEMAAMLASGAKAPRREQTLRPEQIEALRLKREPRDHSVTCLEQEDGEGNIEYKLRIKDPHPVRLQQLITQMKYRLSEGNGECFYYIGIEDNGYPKGLDPADLEGSIATLGRMASYLGAAAALLHYIPAAWGRRAALLRVATRTAQEARHTDLRIAVAGSVDAGKSTLVAVLTHGSDGRPMLDNGRGLARMNVFRHKHEMQSGRTSSICHQLLGYDREGRVINYATPAATALTPAEVTSSAAKVLTFLDLGGHEKYLKTALYGMTALLPDYGLLAVCAVAGLGRITREHLAVAVALEMPVAVVLTKVELVRPERLSAVLAEVRQLVALTMQHESGPQRAQLSAAEAERRVEAASPLVSTEAEAQDAARVLCQLHADSLASPTARGALRVHMPVFAVSAVTGAGLPALHAFLAALQPGAALKRAGSMPRVPLVPSPGAGAVAAQVGGLSAALGGPPSAPGSSAGGAPSVAGSAAGADSSSSGAVTDSGCTSEDGTPRAGAGLAAGEGAGSPSPFAILEGAAAAAVTAAPSASAAPLMPQHLLCAPPPQAAALGTGAVTAVVAAADGTVAVTATTAAAAHWADPITEAEAQSVHFQVDGTFEVEGVGSVLSGTLLSGVVRLGQQLVLGPTAEGGFARVVVRQLQRSHVAVQVIRAGQTATIAISPADVAPRGEGVDVGVRIDKPAGVGGSGGFGGEAVTLPLGSSPGAAPGGGALPLAAMAVAAAPLAATAGGGGGGFDAVLAAAQDALDLCLGLEDDAAGGDDLLGGDLFGCGGDDGLFAFDAPESPGGAKEGEDTGNLDAGFGRISGGSDGLGSGHGTLPLSMSLCQLHSTTSFSVGAGGAAVSGSGGLAAAAALSSSAPVHARSLSMGAVAGTSPPLLGGAMSGCRKGAVLLEPALEPRTSWAFEAVLLLLGGHWPPRGLLSGCWPPACEDDLEAGIDALAIRVGAAEAAASGSELVGGAAGDRGPMPVPVPGAATRRRRQRSAGGGTYVTVVHCGSVRQPAQVLLMQEMHDETLVGEGVPGVAGAGGSCCEELRISASTRAAAALLHSARSEQPGSPTSAAAAAAAAAAAGGGPRSRPADQDLGCLVRVVLRWQHRPEWLREGAKLLVRDRCDGRVAGAGFVKRVL